MSSVSTGKSLIVIGGIEKYAKVSKKKKNTKNKIREKLHLGLNKQEKKEAERDERDRMIEEGARRDHANANANADTGNTGSGGEEREKEVEQHKQVDPDMQEGKRVEDMTEDQRAQRAVALIRSAVSKGLKGREGEVERHGEEGGETRALGSDQMKGGSSSGQGEQREHQQEQAGSVSNRDFASRDQVGQDAQRQPQEQQRNQISSATQQHLSLPSQPPAQAGTDAYRPEGYSEPVLHFK